MSEHRPERVTDDAVCGETYEHDLDLLSEGHGGKTRVCLRCGAEIFESDDMEEDALRRRITDRLAAFTVKGSLTPQHSLDDAVEAGIAEAMIQIRRHAAEVAVLRGRARRARAAIEGWLTADLGGDVQAGGVNNFLRHLNTLLDSHQE